MIDLLLSQRAARVMLALLAAIALVAALHLAQHILAPTVFALVLGIVISPVADRLYGLGVPRLAVAVLLLVATLALIGLALLLVEPLFSLLIDELPRIKVAVAGWIETASGLLRGIETISAEIENSVGAQAAQPQTAVPSVRDALWLAPGFAAQVFIFVGVLFFFVLTRSELYAGTGPMEQRFRRADRAVARYFAAVTLVNIGLGVVTAMVLTAAGVNYAVLWGLAAALLNFILYLGPMMIIAGLTIAGLVQFSGAQAFLPPFLFLLLNLTEANFVTPLVVGKRLAMNPLLIFTAIVFGLWLWGPVVAIVALPGLLWAGVVMRPSLAMRGPGAAPYVHVG
jgi:predicted PurR-regulated permease PerM